jgi:hypothetical protein
MPVFLFIAGTLLCVVGLFLIGFFIPNRDFSVGSTFILVGTMSIVGGLLLFGLGTVVRELRKLTKSMEKPGQFVRPAAGTGPTRPVAPVPVRQMPKPAVVNTARNQRAEPRLEIPPQDGSPPEPPPSNAPTIGDMTAHRPRPGLFASIRGRATIPPSADAEHPPMPASPRNGAVEPPAFERNHAPAVDAEPVSRSPSLSALAARTAARLDLPRPVPDLPRAVPERPSTEPGGFGRPAPERGSEKPSRNLFDTVWPSDAKSPTEQGPESERKGPPGIGSERRDDLAAAGATQEPRAAEILKSGVIDGMAYTLYTDGSIEAQLPQGTLRFGSIEDLRAHLERKS